MDILLVDDSKTMRLLVTRAIRQAGYRSLVIAEAGDGQEALTKLRGDRPKLILSDWNMPEMSGIEFLRQVRDVCGPIPFGFITSEVAAQTRETAMSSGARFLITKPFAIEEVQAALDPILGG